LTAATVAWSQVGAAERLSSNILDVLAPSARVSGPPGAMQFTQQDCRQLPRQDLRQRIVLTAIQEWAYFGFSVYDLTDATAPDYPYRRSWRSVQASPSEAERVAPSIAGYWAVAPNSGWILAEQNNSWERMGPGSRWRNPWSAAFVSWVMCEAGLADSNEFARAIAHITYIDQAIDARDGRAPESAYVAYDPGEATIEPGDMLCRGSRPSYRSIDERRSQRGEGARTHCDIVVKVDTANDRFLVIGGNVRGWVRLKLVPGAAGAKGLVPAPFSGRRMFAHLKLQADPVAPDLFESSPNLSSLECERPARLLAQRDLTDISDCS